jgi:alpha-ketoglutarate-dependent taurine dioxygenase
VTAKCAGRRRNACLEEEDFVIWDNRSVIHKANPDYDMNERRYLYRLMLKGETPV